MTFNASSPTRRWSALVIKGVVVLFLVFDTTLKLLQLAPAVAGTVELGYGAHLVLPIGLLEALLLALYLVPRTAPLGAVLWTGYLGGAVATHVRLGNPLFTHVLSPIYVAILLWGGLWLTDRRVRQMLAPR